LTRCSTRIANSSMRYVRLAEQANPTLDRSSLARIS
jgi:hypothetical protein